VASSSSAHPGKVAGASTAAGSGPVDACLGCPQPASASASTMPSRGIRPAPAAPLESRPTERLSMWVIYLEAAGVLLLVLFFVWWTMRGRK
jgi:hypothetical protein